MTEAPGPLPLAPFRSFAAQWLPRLEQVLDDMVPSATSEPQRLHAAIRHAMFPGGKRLRPLLALVAAQASGRDPAEVLRPAASLELLHTYSLVHDDLPAMDDDALRRGRPTCHIAFDEATAILTGDALLTQAFEVVAEAGAPAVIALARAAGSLGMVAGQAADLAAETSTPDFTQVEWIHDRKTGALITASLEVGALAAGRNPAELEPWREYGRLIGRAFQIADDCLDLTGSSAELGKEPGQDLRAGKMTYPAVHGLEASRAIARELAARAAGMADALCNAKLNAFSLDEARELLQDIPYFFVERKT